MVTVVRGDGGGAAAVASVFLFCVLAAGAYLVVYVAIVGTYFNRG